MNDGFSLFRILLQSSGLVQIVLLLLLAASVLSWAVIVSKRNLVARTQKLAQQFESRFWSGGTLTDLYDNLHGGGRDVNEGLAPIFLAGYEEFTRQQQGRGRVNPEDALASVQRQMRVTQSREIEKLEGGLALLATIGSTSPYVGLFGTVWGIMNAFVAIGNVKQASLAMVAPGIAEALIATAMGLFAAIPAVIAYNFFTASVDRLEGRYNNFSDEMAGIIERGLRGLGGERA